MKIHKSIVTGIAALFLGLAGSAYANPFFVRDTSDVDVHWANSQGHNGTVIVLARYDQLEKFLSLADSYSVGLIRGYDIEAFRHNDWRTYVFIGGQPISTAPKSSAPTTVSAAAPVASVPDGGTTAAMVGFALMGLAFIRKVQPA